MNELELENVDNQAPATPAEPAVEPEPEGGDVNATVPQLSVESGEQATPPQQTTPDERSVEAQVTELPHQAVQPAIGQTIIDAFAQANAPLAPETHSILQQNEYTNDQLLEMRETDPVGYDRLLVDRATQISQDAASKQFEDFQHQAKQEAVGRDTDALIADLYPDYNNSESTFSSDVKHVLKGIGKEPHLQRLAACALVQSLTGKDEGIKAAKRQGAIEEKKRSTNASNSIGAGSRPQQPKQEQSVDPYYQKWGPVFGADPKNVQHRHNTNPESKNSFC